MIKNLVPFLYCLTPAWVFADTVFPGNPGEITPISGSLNLTGESYIFQSGIGINVNGALITAGGVYVGYDAIPPLVAGSVYAESGVGTNYSILTDGNVSVAMTLDVAGAKNLVIRGIGGSSFNFDAAAVEAEGGLDLIAGAVSLGQFVASGSGTAEITGNSLSVSGNAFQALDSKNVIVNLGGGAFNVSSGSIENKSVGTMALNTGAIVAQNITNEANEGVITINATSLNLTGGDSLTTASFINKGDFVGVISGATVLAHGFDLASMTAENSFSLMTGTLSLGDRENAFYDNNLNSFSVMVTNGDIDAGTIRNGFVNQNAQMSLSASGTINADGIVANAGVMNLYAADILVGTGGISVGDTGRLNALGGTDVISGGAVSVAKDLVAGTGVAGLGGMGVVGGFTSIDAGDFDVNIGGGMSANGTGNGIAILAQTINVANDVTSRTGGQIVLNSGTINVGGGVGGDDVALVNPGVAEGIRVNVGGDILGGTDIIGLSHMLVGGDYTFDSASRLNAFVNSGDGYTYWGFASFDESNLIGTIVNTTPGAEPLISVSGKLITDVSVENSMAASLADSQIGINLRDSVTGDTAIWLLHADNGIEELATKIAALNVNFCNADGTFCTDYLSATNTYNGAGTDLPIRIVSYDTDGDGDKDSLYVVFDERLVDYGRFFKLQPIVASAPYYTRGEYQSAGALDNLIEYSLLAHGFSYESPIGVARVLFEDTPLYRVSDELYFRMQDYSLNKNSDVIRAFSRLFQLREANQIADMLELNTHTVFNDLSNRFIDESIWNRNRRLNKLWFTADYGYFMDDLVDHHADGSRIGFNFGYDWQSSDTLIFGWTGHITHTRGNDSDAIDLGYGMVDVAGNVDTDVRNLNVGGGAYFIKTLGNKARWYGDALFDLNLVDVIRNQTWVDTIDGDATSYGLVGETGLIHDWLNQYIIGNLYLRAGYNFGFDMTEKVNGTDYMNLDFDGYVVLTPGYSLTAQKRIYPSAWFQFRPYATIGIEYDMISTPSTMSYKFAVVDSWTDYDIDVDPLWVHAGAGVEFLSVNGLHVGIDYRYQYNSNVQMHKVRLSGMYRF